MADIIRQAEDVLRRPRRRQKPDRDRSKSFFQVGVEAYEREELTGTERGIFVALCSFADNDKGTCWPGIQKIAQRSGFGASSVKEAIKTFERLGMVTIHREIGRSNYYTLRDHRGRK